MEHTQQRPLYDCTSFTAAVGGALGLFLGFSFLDFARGAVDWGADKLGNGRRRKEERQGQSCCVRKRRW